MFYFYHREMYDVTGRLRYVLSLRDVLYHRESEICSSFYSQETELDVLYQLSQILYHREMRSVTEMTWVQSPRD